MVNKLSTRASVNVATAAKKFKFIDEEKLGPGMVGAVVSWASPSC